MLFRMNGSLMMAAAADFDTSHRSPQPMGLTPFEVRIVAGGAGDLLVLRERKLRRDGGSALFIKDDGVYCGVFTEAGGVAVAELALQRMVRIRRRRSSGGGPKRRRWPCGQKEEEEDVDDSSPGLI